MFTSDSDQYRQGGVSNMIRVVISPPILLLVLVSALLLISPGAVSPAYAEGGGAAGSDYKDSDISDSDIGDSDTKDADYVGASECVDCHAQEYQSWSGSHHDQAMQHVDEQNVLGDFDDVTFSYAGISSRFFRQGERFMVTTDGPDGKLHDYEIRYTFGVYPLQQYLVEFEDGRLQALTIAWDTRPESEGGQRWFHLYPDESIDHRDELHWTRSSHNWNGMCAACHSTDLQKNYHSDSNTFNTRWAEIDVSCEACHGPASEHIEWAGRDDRKDMENAGFDLSLDERKGIHWVIPEGGVTARRSSPRTMEKEIEVCAPCHSRRSTIAEGFEAGKPLHDFYLPQLLSENMYFADGQIQDEVFVYGSFLQSKMYHAGVSCSDCHEPHSLQLRAEGNAVCLQCHAAKTFDSKQHHHHDKGSDGAQCAECHMPPRTYMVVDPRHDHSFRIPRPDLSVSIGVPNACNNCHADRDAQWAATKVKQWYGDTPASYQQFARALDAARENRPGAGALLIEQIGKAETPDIARASAMREFAAHITPSTLEVITDGLADDSALVRLASVQVLEGLPAPILVEYVFPVLDDPVRIVRVEAARILASVPTGRLQGKQQEVYERAVDEYIGSQVINADRPEAQSNLGNFYAASGDTDSAIGAYRKAIELNDAFVPAYINLADVYRTMSKNDEAARVLNTALGVSPDSAVAWHSLGLVQVRQQDLEQAISSLQRAADIDRSNVRYSYVYAVALNSAGEPMQAIEVMQDAHDRFPNNIEVLQALVAFHRDAGNDFAAQQFMNKLNRLGVQ